MSLLLGIFKGDNPMDMPDSVSFADLFDPVTIQQVQDEFAAATGVASIITRPDGTPITRPSNFCRLCNDIIRCTDTGLRNCFHSDAIIGRYHPEGPLVQQCLSGGLWDAGASISVGGRHIANWLIGQVRDESQSEERMREYARAIGANESAVIEAFRDVPSMSVARFKQIAQLLFTMANQLSKSAHQNVLQARFIADSKHAGEALRESEDKFKYIFDHSPLGKSITLPSGGISVNKALCEMLGYSAAELSSRKWQDVTHPDDIEATQCEMDQILGGRKQSVRFTKRFLRKDGAVMWADMNSALRRDKNGNPLYFITTISDITNQKRVEAALRESEARFRSYFQLPLHGLTITSPDKGWLVVNDKICSILGYTREEITRLTWSEMTHPDDLAADVEQFNRVLSGEIEQYRLEKRFIRKDGSIVWTTISVGCVRKSDGSVDYIVCAMEDITERKMAEGRELELREKLERAARMESLGVLAGGVAHDLNNVLGPLVGLPDMVTEYIERHSDPADPEYADTIESMRSMKTSALRAVSVVSDLVVMGRRGQFQLVPVDVNLVIEQTLDSKQVRVIKARRPDVKVSKKLSDESLWCLGSDSRLVRVLANLVGNAAEAIDGAGDIVVCTRRKILAESFRGYEDVPAGDYVTIEVTDTGCGMDAKTAARIFEPFFSTKAPSERSGSGLGLSVVHGLVKDHAGFLDVKSKPGEGTTFTVYLPAVAFVEVRAASVKDRLHEGHERVLVVDDEPDQQFLTRRLLKRLGYDVTTVSSGEEAVAAFEETRREGRPAPFDLVLTDMMMPGGLDGLSTCRAILKMFPNQEMLILSGYAPEKYEEQVKELGINWLTKPCSPSDLARTIRARLDRK